MSRPSSAALGGAVPDRTGVPSCSLSHAADPELAGMIGAFSANPKTRTFAELLIGFRVAAL